VLKTRRLKMLKRKKGKQKELIKFVLDVRSLKQSSSNENNNSNAKTKNRKAKRNKSGNAKIVKKVNEREVENELIEQLKILSEIESKTHINKEASLKEYNEQLIKVQNIWLAFSLFTEGIV